MEHVKECQGNIWKMLFNSLTDCINTDRPGYSDLEITALV